jgi:hypothetical protein
MESVLTIIKSLEIIVLIGLAATRQYKSAVQAMMTREADGRKNIF